MIILLILFQTLKANAQIYRKYISNMPMVSLWLGAADSARSNCLHFHNNFIWRRLIFSPVHAQCQMQAFRCGAQQTNRVHEIIVHIHNSR